MVLAKQAAANFISRDQAIAGVERYGQGIIHDTYLVHLSSAGEQFILQRINTEVFREPAAIMHNLRIVCDHVRARMKCNGSSTGTEWRMPEIIPAGGNRDFFIDPGGGFWRALSFVHDASPLEKIAGPDDAREVGRALGIFHDLVSDLDPGSLHDTLPGFHNVESYLAHYDEVLSCCRGGAISASERHCRHFVEERRNWAPVLENSQKQKTLPVRIMHGDPKINNIMVDNRTGRAVSIIDLDTVKPGLVHYDIGDCLRSCCNTLGEEAADPGAVNFDAARCKAVLDGYTQGGCTFLTHADVDFFYDAMRLLPFELGLRFYTDFLEGNIYFKAGSPIQNLNRAMVQFALVQSIEKQEVRLRALVEESRTRLQGKSV